LEKAMPTKQQEKQPADQEHLQASKRTAVLANHVIHALGQPGDLHRVQVRPLWEDHYRVNVLVGVDAACAKVAHSYFLVADSNGNILASTPEITRQY
jgi:predicted NBD/HSP70 family sugar kinase